MSQTAVKADVNEKYAEQYADYLKFKAGREEQIKGLAAQIEKAKQEIDNARIRIDGHVDDIICPKCESYAIIQHDEKSKLSKGDRKVVYQCDICGRVERVDISGATLCEKCGNKSLVFLTRTAYESNMYKCENCGNNEEWE
jgi:predicted RNA-binding Zn-ribbon protein involved in translation (DUF1610 family)